MLVLGPDILLLRLRAAAHGRGAVDELDFNP